MWPFRPNPRVAFYMAREDVLEAAGSWYRSPKSFAKFLCRFNEAEAERVITAYRAQEPGSVRDPILDREEYADIFREVDTILKTRFPEQRMGQCHSVWRAKKQLLKERGISWLSPSELKPFNRYD